ncbi:MULTISPECIES: DUF3180 domain-containing protein [Agromyces]|uniref:DUF3180 domain-containing protein n=1 Tax=Agromyces indicus TaxID=758919 RepID=A0ABU1FLK9_9MICO|nr:MULTISPECIES: DUF3180 domain-containing protein [Agromyces]KZE92717.1 hypothetical protein AVP42_02262 [Agromyces sp. NDB4Y10]MCK8609211.1 DUF3180 domain-containing protein [Agromyces sp. C10]MDR5692641.1 DUF3180 domain-containing protein [Agromyces indicus]
MKRTHASTLVAFGFVGLAVGYLVELALVSAGAQAVVPPLSLAITLVGVGALVLAFAWPIRQAVRGTATRRIDPFRAARTAVLAKASSITGALVLGAGVGITAFLLTRSVLPAASTVWTAVATAAGAALLLAAGLVAEHFCTIPPDEPDEEGAARA